MKQTLPILFALVLMSSCNLYNQVSHLSNRIEKHAKVETHVVGKMVYTTLTVDSIHATDVIKRKCPQAVINYDISQAKITAKVVCNMDSLAVLKGKGADRIIELLLPKEK